MSTGCKIWECPSAVSEFLGVSGHPRHPLLLRLFRSLRFTGRPGWHACITEPLETQDYKRALVLPFEERSCEKRMDGKFKIQAIESSKVKHSQIILLLLFNYISIYFVISQSSQRRNDRHVTSRHDAVLLSIFTGAARVTSDKLSIVLSSRKDSGDFPMWGRWRGRMRRGTVVGIRCQICFKQTTIRHDVIFYTHA